MPIPLGILAVAGAGGGALTTDYVLLQSALISSNTSTVSFNNLNTYSQYKHFQIRAIVKTSRSSTSDALNLIFNGDSAANYAFHRLRGDGSSVTAQSATSRNAIELGNIVGNTNSGIYSPVIIDLLDLAGTKNKTTRTFIASQTSLEVYGGLWMNTAAATSLSITPAVGPAFVAGSRFSLYGLR